MSMIQEEKTTTECLARSCKIKSEYFREAIRRSSLEKELRRITRENELYKKATNLLMLEINDLLKPNSAAIKFVKESLSKMPEVDSSYYFVKNEVINIWIITKEENFEAEIKIAEILRELLHIFENLRFDFMVIPKYEIKLKEILSSDSEKIFP